MVTGLSLNISQAQGFVSLQVFYRELQPYGTWIQHPTYGNVWLPRVDDNFIPYSTNGYWAYTDYGNTWVSDFVWGWAPFHYGRWFYDDFYGWAWVPDTVWGPAWVVWRNGGGYYGWAPLMPGLSINVSVSYYDCIPHHYWSFVPYRYITYRHVYSYCVPRTQVVNVIHQTTIINYNYTDNRRHTYFTGPSRSDIEQASHSHVDIHRVNNRVRPGASNVDRGEINLYRPEMDNSRYSRINNKPSRFETNNRNDNNFGSRERSNSGFQEATLPDNIQQDYSNSRNERDKSNMNNGSRSRESSSWQQYRQSENQNVNRSNKNFSSGNSTSSDDRSRSYKPVEKQNNNSFERNAPQQHESRTFQYNQGRDQRTFKQPQQVERSNSNDSNRQTYQQRSTTTSAPNYNRSSGNTVQHSEPIQRSSTTQTQRSSTSSGGSSRSVKK
ncbi:MAG TPA: DUF6600 domain-containing protein [Cyclobacteriaceae bacterium]|nr:DUF6600 domain-containing protein [Cyclobacteriaceae bacterium]